MEKQQNALEVEVEAAPAQAKEHDPDAARGRDVESPATEQTNRLSRRAFLGRVSALGFGALISSAAEAWGLERVDDPLSRYPSRDWERTYRDLFQSDSSFVFTCAPNDTHNCLLRAHVKSGVITRISPTYGYGKATDVYGNGVSARWDPRCCQKGLALARRFYGDRRVRYPMIRKGFREWVAKGFPRDPVTGAPPPEMFRRGWDSWTKATWEEATQLVAKVLLNIAQTYSGEAGKQRLLAQHYYPETVAAAGGAGTQVMKFRGGMPLLGITRVFGFYRFANMMALVDHHVRQLPPDKAVGARGFDNYSWHTDLPPGHPMVTGHQTVEFDLHAVEHAKLVIAWGMNWVTTKMPDVHWLTEARLKGTKVVVIACEYSSTASKGDDVIVVRPGTTPALALGLAHVIIRDKLYDEAYVKRFTDLPLLVRSDTLQLLKAKDLNAKHQSKPLANFTRQLKTGEKPPPPGTHREQLVPEALRAEWGDCVVWDTVKRAPAVLTRDQVGKTFDQAKLSPALEGEFEVTLEGGKLLKVKTVFEVLRTTVLADATPATTAELTWAPATAIEALAKDIARARGKTLFTVGMGPNQFFNNDLKDRAIFLVAALTANVGQVGGNVGSFAGNYRVALFNGSPQYIMENPFDLELDPAKPARPRPYFKFESAHYYNHEDHPLKIGKKMLTGDSHMPTPTKSLWFANANSILGNVKWHYNVVNNVLPRIELVAVNEWWWSTSCEYADVVFAVDSWAELKQPDMTASVTNPFLCVFPRTPLPRVYDTRGDAEVLAAVARQLGGLLGDKRCAEMWKFVEELKTDVYLQRVLDASATTKGYVFSELEAKAKEGIPALMMTRTTPKVGGWEQINEGRPWYTKSGRLELYRDEPEFIAAGENLPVHREPIDSTFYEPNVIVCSPHAYLRPTGPAEYGVDVNDLSCEVRQGRNVVKPWSELQRSPHPLAAKGYRFVFHTPKYRHGAHTTPIDTDQVAVWFGPFADLYRRDKRMPFVSEGYVDINPLDARELGVDDGDYVWIDSDPEDRPYRGWKAKDPAYKVARLLCRARYYPGTPRGITRMWFNMYAATPGSVRGHEKRADGLAKNEETNYQAMFRYGSHQSATRGWLKPTLMTDSLVRKDTFGQTLGKGFMPDVHCPTGAPRESIVKITRAEPGGIGGKGRWRPLALKLRPSDPSSALTAYLRGGFIKKG